MSDASPSDVLAVIPARGGSKGLASKNLLPFHGVPLVERAVQTARAARTIERVIVSTDDEEIARISERAGATIVRRPAELSGDTASSESSLAHVLKILTEIESPGPRLVAMIQCTAPLLVPEDIDGTVETMLRAKAQSAFAAAEFRHFLWDEHVRGARGINHDHQAVRRRRQDLDVQYLEAGSVYVMEVATFLKEQTRFCGRTVIYPIPAERCCEIDRSFDLKLAEARARILQGTSDAGKRE